MKVFRNPWWWLAVVAVVLHQVAERYLGYDTGLIDDYLDPFFAPPILLGLWLVERRWIFRAPTLTVLETVVATLLLSIVFEEVFPRLEEGFVRDPVDYGMYALGGLYFHLLINRGTDD